jgi:trk system potassium uptake protein TrkH
MFNERDRLKRLDQFAALLGLIAFLMLVLRFGFPALKLPPVIVLSWSALLFLGLFLESLYRLLIVHDPWSYLSRNPARYAVLLIIVLELSGVAAWSLNLNIPQSSLSVILAEVYLVIFLFANIGSWIQALILANRWLANLRIPVLLLPATTFAIAIVLGALFLHLPGMHNVPVSFLDNIFTAVSAICVTGLSVYDVGQTLTPVGKTVLFILIQLGGLGTLTVMGMLALWYGGKLTIGERAAFSSLLGGKNLRETRKLIAAIIKVTFSIEIIGAVFLWLLWRHKVAHPLLQGIFHAVSAFCNAGFSMFPTSLEAFADDSLLLLVFMALIFAGGIGFPVLADLWKVTLSRIIPWRTAGNLRQSTRVTLLVSFSLISIGFVFFVIDGFAVHRPRNFIVALFQSVTTRTAGFQVESQLNFGMIGFLMTMMLMALGASPQSTGGGIKTTVVARLFKKIDRQDSLIHPKKLFFFKPFRIALLLVSIYLCLALGGGLLILVNDNIHLKEAFFESFSALGTVGLSHDLTAKLSFLSKWILIVLMFFGRILFPTLVMRIIRTRRPSPDAVEWT